MPPAPGGVPSGGVPSGAAPSGSAPAWDGPGRGRSGLRPLIPARRRGAAAALVVACTAVTLALGLIEAGRTRPGRFDAAVDAWVRTALGAHPALLNALGTLGDMVPVTVLTVALVLACAVGLGFHYFTDIVGGAALGTGTALFTALLLDTACGNDSARARIARLAPAPVSPAGPRSRGS